MSSASPVLPDTIGRDWMNISRVANVCYDSLLTVVYPQPCQFAAEVWRSEHSASPVKTAGDRLGSSPLRNTSVGNVVCYRSGPSRPKNVSRSAAAAAMMMHLPSLALAALTTARCEFQFLPSNVSHMCVVD